MAAAQLTYRDGVRDIESRLQSVGSSSITWVHQDQAVYIGRRLQWLRPAAAHNPHSPNSDGEPSAFAEVSPTHSLFRNSLKIPSLNPCCTPKIVPRRGPRIASSLFYDFFPEAPKGSQNRLCCTPKIVPRRGPRIASSLFYDFFPDAP